MKVGFIGLGAMGLPMARNLLKAGHEVTVYNRTRERAESLRAEGATIANQAGDTCGGDVLITMLSDDRALRAVVIDGQLISKLAPGAVHISMSTISVALARELAQAHAEAGNHYIELSLLGRNRPTPTPSNWPATSSFFQWLNRWARPMPCSASPELSRRSFLKS